MNTALATTAPTALATPSTAHRISFTPAQETLIRKSFLNGATADEAGALLEVARLRGLNPITRQIHFVKRSTWNADTKTKEDAWAFQIAIDGLRALAERSGLYEGQDEPETEEDGKGMPKVSRVKVWKKGHARPFVGVARFREYAQFTKDGGLTKMWREKPFLMLEKCAEALALRKDFPEDLADLYEEAELPIEGVLEGPKPPARIGTSAPAPARVVELDDTAEAQGFADAIESSADQKTLGKVAAAIAEAYAGGKLRDDSRASLLKSYGARRKALADAAKASKVPESKPALEEASDAHAPEVESEPAPVEAAS